MVNVTAGYALSPRTHVAMTVVGSKSFVAPGGYYTSAVQVALSRTMSRRWFVQVQGGSAMVHAGGTAATVADKPTYLAGAAIGFKTYAHTFLVSGNRTISNAYGLASSSETAGAAWSWRRPNWNWWLAAEAAEERAQNNVPYDIRAWRANASLGRSLTRQLAFTVSYGLTRYRGVSVADHFNGRFGVASVGISWAPRWNPALEAGR
jgi:hypothetical protein